VNVVPVESGIDGAEMNLVSPKLFENGLQARGHIQPPTLDSHNEERGLFLKLRVDAPGHSLECFIDLFRCVEDF